MKQKPKRRKKRHTTATKKRQFTRIIKHPTATLSDRRYGWKKSTCVTPSLKDENGRAIDL